MQIYTKINLNVPVTRGEDREIVWSNFETITVDSRYLEIKGTLKNTSRYPYFDISDL